MQAKMFEDLFSIERQTCTPCYLGKNIHNNCPTAEEANKLHRLQIAMNYYKIDKNENKLHLHTKL